MLLFDHPLLTRTREVKISPGKAKWLTRSIFTRSVTDIGLTFIYVFAQENLCLFQKALPVIVKVEKLGDIPDTKAANTQDNSEVRPDKEETDTTSEEAEQEAELEDETDAKTKRAASITRVENLENLLIMWCKNSDSFYIITY